MGTIKRVKLALDNLDELIVLLQDLNDILHVMQGIREDVNELKAEVAALGLRVSALESE